MLGHADEVTQLHQFRLFLVIRSKLVERLLDWEELAVIPGGGKVHLLELIPVLVASMAGSALATGAISENPAHRFRRRSEEVSMAIPVLVLVSDQSQPSFMHQCGGLQSLAR